MIEKAIEEFNKIHKTKCKILKKEESEIVVLFEGHICFTCGTYDYFEDLAIKISEKLGKKYEVYKYEEIDGKYIVYYKPSEKIKKKFKEIKIILFEE